jgi:hypothetical protein
LRFLFPHEAHEETRSYFLLSISNPKSQIGNG